MKFRFLAPAEEEMLEAAFYYEMQVESLGTNFLDIIEKAITERTAGKQCNHIFTKKRKVLFDTKPDLVVVVVGDVNYPGPKTGLREPPKDTLFRRSPPGDTLAALKHP